VYTSKSFVENYEIQDKIGTRGTIFTMRSLIPSRTEAMDFLIGSLDKALEVGGVLLRTGLCQMEFGTLDQTLAIGYFLLGGQFTDRLPVQLVQLR